MTFLPLHNPCRSFTGPLDIGDDNPNRICEILSFMPDVIRTFWGNMPDGSSAQNQAYMMSLWPSEQDTIGSIAVKVANLSAHSSVSVSIN